VIAFAVRNLKLYFRDRASVFFSLLAVLITLGLYIGFLANTLTSGLDMPGARFLMDSWMMAGLLAVTTVTTTLGAAGVLVDDRAKGIAKDFHCAPLQRSTIVGGYLLSSVAVGVLMTLAAFVLAEVCIVANGGRLLPLAGALKALGLIVLSTAASGALVSFLVSFLRTLNAFGVASTIIGTLSGFLMGIYVPVGLLPQGVQAVIRIFPMSHAAVLLRQVFLEVPLAEAFQAAPPPVVSAFQEEMGVVFTVGEGVISSAVSIGFLLCSAAVFFVLTVWRMLKE